MAPSLGRSTGHRSSGVSQTSAPSMRRITFFSSGTPSGMVTVTPIPLSAARAARAIPVFPEVASTRSRSPRPALDQAGQEVAGRSVLDRPEGVEPLQLEVDLALARRHHVVEPDQGGRVVHSGEQIPDVQIAPQPLDRCRVRWRLLSLSSVSFNLGNKKPASCAGAGLGVCLGSCSVHHYPTGAAAQQQVQTQARSVT